MWFFKFFMTTLVIIAIFMVIGWGIMSLLEKKPSK